VIRVVVCGMAKEQIARAARETAGPAAEVTVTSDFEAATAIQQGRADYYIGACQSGAGGALAIATALLGRDRVIRLSGVGSTSVDPGQVASALDEGKVAFGIANSHVATAVPTIVRAILDHARAS
jgi:Protein of unknown function DUF2620